MIEVYISGQTLRLYTPLVAADSFRFLEAQVNFTDNEWQALGSRWLHFVKGERELKFKLDGSGRVPRSAGLNLDAGVWDVFLTGGYYDDETRATTNVQSLTVQPSGLRQAPLGELPISVAEQLERDIQRANNTANEIRAAAQRGDFDGKDGKSFHFLGYVATYADLPESADEVGDMYGVGSTSPYSFYVWSGSAWVNNGNLIQGPEGEQGEDGKYAVPTISAAGQLSFTWSDGTSEELPQDVPIKGEKGDKGDQGIQGKSAYQAALDGGMEGINETTFNQLFSKLASHHRSHEPGGSDQIVNLDHRSIAEAARTQYIDVNVPAAWTEQTGGGYAQVLTVEGIAAGDRPKVHFKPPTTFSELTTRRAAFALLYRCEVTAAETVKLYAEDAAETAYDVTLEVARI